MAPRTNATAAAFAPVLKARLIMKSISPGPGLVHRLTCNIHRAPPKPSFTERKASISFWPVFSILLLPGSRCEVEELLTFKPAQNIIRNQGMVKMRPVEMEPAREGSRKRASAWCRRSGLLLLATALAGMVGCSLFAFPPDKKDKEEKKREKAIQKEMESPYRKWLTQEVPYIITPEERSAFLKLSTDDEREQFIEAFWERRN